MGDSLTPRGSPVVPQGANRAQVQYGAVTAHPHIFGPTTRAHLPGPLSGTPGRRSRTSRRQGGLAGDTSRNAHGRAGAAPSVGTTLSLQRYEGYSSTAERVLTFRLARAQIWSGRQRGRVIQRKHLKRPLSGAETPARRLHLPLAWRGRYSGASQSGPSRSSFLSRPQTSTPCRQRLAAGSAQGKAISR